MSSIIQGKITFGNSQQNSATIYSSGLEIIPLKSVSLDSAWLKASDHPFSNFITIHQMFLLVKPLKTLQQLIKEI